MDDNSLMLRQINPSFIQQGRVTSQAFRPTPKDEQRLSVYDGDQISPPAAIKHYTEVLGYSSVGVMAVDVLECKTLNLAVLADPIPFPEHAVIDFSPFNKTLIEKKAKLLKAKAESRGWLHQVSP